MRTLGIMAWLLASTTILTAGLAATCEGAGKWIVSGSASMPQGDFGESDPETGGMAGMGFGAGVEYIAPLGSDPRLKWVIGVWALRNPVDESKLSAVIDEEYELQDTDYNVEPGVWMNIPIVGGLRYESPLSPTNTIYGTAQVGMNFIRPPTMKFDFQDEDDGIEGEMSIESATAFGLVIGGGVVFNDKFTVGLRYMTFGKPSLDATSTVTETEGDESETETESLQRDLSLSMVLLTAGMKF